MKQITLIAIAAFLSLAIIIGVFAFPWILIFIGIALQPDPPKPKITYGEFPFKLVCEIDGERKVIEDTLICEYDGVDMDEGQGKFRKWKDYLASGGERIVLLKVEKPIPFRGSKKVVNQEIWYSPGSARDYMGDLESYETYDFSLTQNGFFYEEYDDGTFNEGVLSASELLSKFKIKLISWDCTEPIRNTFSDSYK